MKYICIHGHFYQPPRENAWLEQIETQPSAFPFHDWNERINFECYAPNRSARVLNDQGEIVKIENNYSKISFNFGPTLLSWLEENDSITYQEIIAADKTSVKTFDGHGNAMAQVYNHIIMPLASDEDKLTQVVWGIEDFKHRFGRMPEGMWLAETAIDSATAAILIQQGIKFVVLAPRQAQAYSSANGETIPVEGEVDTTKSYFTEINGKRLEVFFYNGQISQAVAFEKLLNDGRLLANKLIQQTKVQDDNSLVSIATDGETYGHHHRFGEMALASCIQSIEEVSDLKLVNYAWYAANFPSNNKIILKENSSWSCYHGIERWRSDCGCSTGENSQWNQAWRTHLRDALDFVRDNINASYKAKAEAVFIDHQNARNAYISVLLNRNTKNIYDFVDKQVHQSYKKEKQDVLRMMEMQRNMLLMYTSCGWFFDEVTRIETNQILQYAARALRYAEDVLNIDLWHGFKSILSKAKSNDPSKINALINFEKEIITGELTLEKVGMHVATLAVFEEELNNFELFNYRLESKLYKRVVFEEHVFVYGVVEISSKITLKKVSFGFVTAYFGQHYLFGIIKTAVHELQLIKKANDFIQDFKVFDFSTAKDRLINDFEGHPFDFEQLFKDQRIKIFSQINKINSATLLEANKTYYESQSELMVYGEQVGYRVPTLFSLSANVYLNKSLVEELKKGKKLSIVKLENITTQMKRWAIDFKNLEKISWLITEAVYELLDFQSNEMKIRWLEKVEKILMWSRELAIDVNLWKAQNQWFKIYNNFDTGENNKPPEVFVRIGQLLDFEV